LCIIVAIFFALLIAKKSAVLFTDYIRKFKCEGEIKKGSLFIKTTFKNNNMNDIILLFYM